MGKRPRRKIVLFLVEGQSDRNALRNVISELYDKIDENIEVFFPVINKDGVDVGGDLMVSVNFDEKDRTGDKPEKILEKNIAAIEKKLAKYFLNDFFDREKIYPKDIYEIVQITDLDGAFIPAEAVCGHGEAEACLEAGVCGESDVCGHGRGESDVCGRGRGESDVCGRGRGESDERERGREKPYYGKDRIICSDRDFMIRRNITKSYNLNIMSSLSTIKVGSKRIPYSLYYFSCNLDHFIHNNANLDPRLKCSLADAYARMYYGRPEAYMEEMISDQGSLKGMNYPESWEFAREGLNSLHRHTNINVLFEVLRREKLV